MKNSKCLPNERRQLRDQLTRSCVFFPIKRASSRISAIGAKEPRSNQWNMLMPVREYNKHIAKIPNCKMRQRQRPALRATSASLLLLLLHVVHSLDPAAGSGAAGSGGGGAAAAGGAGGGGSGAGGPAAAGGSGGGSLSGGPTTLIANLTEQGSPGVYNSTMG
ncbi:transcription factor SOX-4 isoform X2 [Drosophila ficusphila]|uniref:transcription factor SOX-4 isoform X2 n=2 Tax=Drosophila ficusphila TaxID=30025 RepID=UPI0007E8B4CB|nr:transcription factor SOX-4 isoform X2 [Drosophila ficusphila]